MKYSAGLRLACVSINDTSDEADWRNSDVRHIIRTNDLSGVTVVPFYANTLPLWDMHVNGKENFGFDSFILILRFYCLSALYRT